MSRNIPSLEELIAKKRAETQQVPKFLSKKERQQLQRQEVQVEQVVEPHTNQSNGSKKILSKDEDIESIRKRQREEEVQRNYKKILQNSRGRKFNFGWEDSNEVNDDDEEDDDLVTKYSLDPIVKPRYDGFGIPGRKTIDDIHWTKKRLEEMKPRDWRIMKENFEIILRGSNVPNPLRYWHEQADMDPQLLDIITKRLGYEEPTPIQRASIPVALQKRDIIGIAETGSGKTLAYLLPMLCKLLNLPRLNTYSKVDGPYGLILVPTRELAQQIEVELNKFLRYLPQIDTISIVGGKLIERNILDLQNKNIEIIIATPGRLIDCLERHYLVLNQTKFLVLDECDKMIEMNFGEQVAKITEFMGIGQRRQNMMFTATMTNDVEQLSKKYVENPVLVNIGSTSSTELTVNERIDEKFEFFPTDDDSKKIKRLVKILESGQYQPPIIVFINYKESGEYINKQLLAKGHRVSLIHGSKSQDQREAALRSFKDGDTDILIGTNVAARGIDVNNVSLVINYQMTKKIDDYVHRVGRTGRAGNYGTAITFLSEKDDMEIINDLKKMSRKSRKKVPEEFKKFDDKVFNIM
ncbi:CYFA0S15e00122g1_1 [Cyberlindnera fabianii]|uniref:RNA helicase n=1 Tax=Cyberlindnera fabianii TaxID=36022 RepID=A0A061BCA3_CYBFA|nr:CYFA0S15e00122g1_1 [Cyberlindnera fabianii]